MANMSRVSCSGDCVVVNDVSSPIHSRMIGIALTPAFMAIRNDSATNRRLGGDDDDKFDSLIRIILLVLILFFFCSCVFAEMFIFDYVVFFLSSFCLLAFCVQLK